MRDDLKITLPKGKTPWVEIEKNLKKYKEMDFDGRAGRLPAYIYYHNEELLEVQKKSYCEYILESGLGAGKAFLSLEYMLSHIKSMALDLFNAPPNAAATFTSGGTGSIFEIIKAARNKARAERGEKYGVFNAVAPYSAHPALDKACQILDLEVKRVGLTDDFRGDVAAIAEAVDDRTILIYASAPCYPYGVFDPIEQISEIAISKNIWLHIDACWGGFISPFAKKLGYEIPLWDFLVSGVTSISADIHKAGYGVKGASLAMFRDQSLQKHQLFEFSNWPRGTYSTETIMGSSPAGSIAAAYAVMNFLGEEGYLETTKAAMDAADQIIKGVNQIDGLKCLEPYGESNLFGFISTDPNVDIMAVADCLLTKGWFPGRLREPLAIQQGTTAVHLPFVNGYLSDLRDAVDVVRKTGAKGEFTERTY